MSAAARAKGFARANFPRFVRELKTLVSIPSVSADSERRSDVSRCASWLAAELSRIGMPTVRVVRTRNHPIVYAEWCRAEGAPTLLVYGHYDVQPASPGQGWEFPPFSARVRASALCGRGASDDKGQLFAHIKAWEAYLAVTGALPVNLKCVFEGEEEIGSPHLEPFVLKHRQELRADVVVISDTPMRGIDAPSLVYSLRGVLGVELEARTAMRDVHSGAYGGSTPGAVRALCQIVSALSDASGAVLVPGFFARVRRPSREERRHMAKHGPSDAELMMQVGVPARHGTAAGVGRRPYSLYERSTILPALTITGMTGGTFGAAATSSIPAVARAYLDFRLVPEQRATDIESLLRSHLERTRPAGVELALRVRSRSDPIEINRQHPALSVAAAALSRHFERPVAFLRRGGSIPAVSVFERVLGTPSVLLGFGLAEDRAHGPNECFGLDRFTRSIQTVIDLLDGLGRRLGGSQIEPHTSLAEAARQAAAIL